MSLFKHPCKILLYSRQSRFALDFRIFGFILFFLLLVIFIFYSQIENYQDPPHKKNGVSLPWWKTSIIYEIYPRSFYDSNGDGVGDLKGVIYKVNYLKDLGIGAVWLTPFYPSPLKDFGYDITDYKSIDPIFGDLNDFDLLLSELKAKGIKLIVDIVPNHTSNKHEWFQKSLKRIDPYTDYYVWKDPKGYDENGKPIPPNNWLSIHDSTWEWSEERKQYYFHNYEKEQPDLNVRSPDVMNELDDIIKFWLNRGVDGIRLDAIARLFEDANVYQDEPVNEEKIGKVRPNYRSYLKEIYTIDQPETFEAIGRWRKICDSYNGDRLLIAEVTSPMSGVMPYYGTDTSPRAHFPFNFYFVREITSPSKVTGHNLKRIIEIWLTTMPRGQWPNWVLGSHDAHRVVSRAGPGLVDALNMMLLLLPGTPVTYYGEEIGMEDTLLQFEDIVDPRGIAGGPEDYREIGRDPERTPMQWNFSHNAGFSSSSKTWLPVNENHKTTNVAAQLNSPQSHLKVYKSLARLRQKKAFTKGQFEFCAVTKEILAFVRHFEGDSYLIVINTSNGAMLFDLLRHSSLHLPEKATVLIRSSFDDRHETQPGSLLSLDTVPLLPKGGLVMNLSSI